MTAEQDDKTKRWVSILVKILGGVAVAGLVAASAAQVITAQCQVEETPAQQADMTTSE